MNAHDASPAGETAADRFNAACAEFQRRRRASLRFRIESALNEPKWWTWVLLVLALPILLPIWLVAIFVGFAGSIIGVSICGGSLLVHAVCAFVFVRGKANEQRLWLSGAVGAGVMIFLIVALLACLGVLIAQHI